VQVVAVAKVHGPSASANGMAVTYTSGGQSWIQRNPHDLRLGNYCPQPN
jgi:hypothetical protein